MLPFKLQFFGKLQDTKIQDMKYLAATAVLYLVSLYLFDKPKFDQIIISNMNNK